MDFLNWRSSCSVVCADVAVGRVLKGDWGLSGNKESKAREDQEIIQYHTERGFLNIKQEQTTISTNLSIIIEKRWYNSNNNDKMNFHANLIAL